MNQQDNTHSALVSPKVLHYLALTLRDRGIDVTSDDEWRAHCPEGKVVRTWRPTFRTLKDLIERALAMSQDDDLGIEVGTRITFGTFALVIPALLTCRNLVEALSIGLRYQLLTGSLLSYETGLAAGGHIFLDVKSRFADASIRRFLVQMEMCVFINVARYLVPQPQPIVRVQTTYEPADMTRLRRHCGCPIVIDRQFNRMFIPFELLATTLPTSDPYALAEVIETLDAALARESSARDIVQKVEAIIVRALPHMPAAENIASELGMSARSLRRKLAEASTSYRDLMDRVRLDRARQRIAEGQLSQTEIAYEVGFESARSLRRLLRSRTSSGSHDA